MRHLVLLGAQVGVEPGVHVVEDLHRVGLGHRSAAVSAREPRGRPPRSRPGRGTSSRRAHLAAARLDPLDRILEPPLLELGRDAVAARVVGGRVRTHPVGEGLDQRRAGPLSRPGQRLPTDGQAGQHVVAVHRHAGHPVGHRLGGDAVTGRLLGERDADGPLVVLAEEDNRRVGDRGPDERFVDVVPGWSRPSPKKAKGAAASLSGSPVPTAPSRWMPMA